jgi:hypothetical protein
MPPISRRGNLQDLADRLDPMGIAMLVDEIPQDLSRRSSSAWAKNALASFRISLARRSSLTSRSSSFTRLRLGGRHALAHAGIDLVSLDPFEQRLRHAADLRRDRFDAAHSDGYSPRCSCTRLTARSRTSGENLFDLFMAPSSQEFEPPQNPGRFITKYLASGEVEPKYPHRCTPSRLDPYVEQLRAMLRRNQSAMRKQKMSVREMHVRLAAMGYPGSYNRVAAFARAWHRAEHERQLTAPRKAFVPLAFAPGEAFQFDWSEDWVRIDGEKVKLQIAQFKPVRWRAAAGHLRQHEDGGGQGARG